MVSNNDGKVALSYEDIAWYETLLPAAPSWEHVYNVYELWNSTLRHASVCDFSSIGASETSNFLRYLAWNCCLDIVLLSEIISCDVRNTPLFVCEM